MFVPKFKVPDMFMFVAPTLRAVNDPLVNVAVPSVNDVALTVPLTVNLAPLTSVVPTPTLVPLS